METVGSTRMGRASSRYGAPAVFSGPVRKWEKKWVHVSPSSFNNNNNNKNSNGSSRLLLRRWTPVANRSSAEDARDVSDEPPRRKFRYTPIAVLEEQQKKGAVEKVENEPIIESDQLTASQTIVNREVHRKLNMNEISEDSKDSNMSKVDLGLDFQGNNAESGQNSDDPVGGP
ncbi:uncharacterized protein LOC131662372 [Vicia villosa]|uniref:uncharacterized protein LOC131662372 n=1 Tax=Vicia villosa TaxID=3911 RepID=UPI00273A8426|nr:uncharacterized protein LOC131662372 [Vicia villosa]